MPHLHRAIIFAPSRTAIAARIARMIDNCGTMAQQTTICTAAAMVKRYVAQETLKKYFNFLSMDDLSLIRHLITTGAWWDHIDYVAKWIVGGLLEQYPEKMKSLLKQWIRDENLWIRRSAILAQLGFKDKTDTELLFSFCDACLEETSFWIRKSIGWALREYAKTNEDAVREFVLQHRDRMSGLSYREATKHIEL